jgi:hypothetical protein
MSKIQELKLIVTAGYVLFCGLLVSAVSFFIVDGLLS